MTTQAKALVLLSGGQDSTTCLHWALRAFGGPDNVRTLAIDYGQRHRVELDAAATIAAMAGVTHETACIPDVLQSTSPLVDHDRDVQGYASADVLPGGIEDTFVPMRNLMFLVLAANRAVASGCTHIITGVSQEDYGGYPDCRQLFLQATNTALTAAVDGSSPPLEIVAPLIDLTKCETVQLAVELGQACLDALGRSHTCYRGETPPCGECHACLLRAKGFEEAGVKDPLIA